MLDKVAVFLDVENLSGWLKAGGGETLLEQANKLGQVAVLKAYGDFSVPSVHLRQPELNLLGFEFVHVYHSVKGKNSADIQMVVDAMEYFARMPDIKWFVLATGDSDFSPLFRRLRELGKSVVGVGPQSALSEAVETSCNQFIYTDEKAVCDSAITTPSTLQKKDALKVLKTVLSKRPNGVVLSEAKNAMQTIEPNFDQKLLGFKQFKKFLESAPEIGTLYQNGKVWHIKATKAKAAKNIAQNNASSAQSTKLKPTTELYRQLLKKKSWRLYPSSFLWDVLTKLDAHFPDGFTHKEGLEYLTEAFSSSHNRTKLRKAIAILFKTDFVKRTQFKNKNDELVLKAQPPQSEQAMAIAVDTAMLKRLIGTCKTEKIPFVHKLIPPLLSRAYGKEQLKTLVAKSQSCQPSHQ